MVILQWRCCLIQKSRLVGSHPKTHKQAEVEPACGEGVAQQTVLQRPHFQSHPPSTPYGGLHMSVALFKSLVVRSHAKTHKRGEVRTSMWGRRQRSKTVMLNVDVQVSSPLPHNWSAGVALLMLMGSIFTQNTGRQKSGPACGEASRSRDPAQSHFSLTPSN
jgi:hypothetical protein